MKPNKPRARTALTSTGTLPFSGATKPLSVRLGWPPLCPESPQQRSCCVPNSLCWRPYSEEIDGGTVCNVWFALGLAQNLPTTLQDWQFWNCLPESPFFVDAVLQLRSGELLGPYGIAQHNNPLGCHASCPRFSSCSGCTLPLFHTRVLPWWRWMPATLSSALLNASWMNFTRSG